MITIVQIHIGLLLLMLKYRLYRFFASADSRASFMDAEVNDAPGARVARRRKRKTPGSSAAISHAWSTTAGHRKSASSQLLASCSFVEEMGMGAISRFL